jgi:hypothetical protein
LFDGKSVKINFTSPNSYNIRRLDYEKKEEITCQLGLIEAEKYRIDCNLKDKSVEGNLNGEFGIVDDKYLLYITNANHQDYLNYQNLQPKAKIDKSNSSKKRLSAGIIFAIILPCIAVIIAIIIIIIILRRKKDPQNLGKTLQNTTAQSTQNLTYN